MKSKFQNPEQVLEAIEKVLEREQQIHEMQYDNLMDKRHLARVAVECDMLDCVTVNVRRLRSRYTVK